ncbi:MAG TPA: prolipoprotein diacylglyceryl transferase family protein, partial [Fimbriimonas sp.]|nr:prolipoprotein diacylglyceryl transferase family protein [Fimbriimonas sp.]
LYDSAMNIGVLLIILALDKRMRKPGLVFGACFIAHGLTRFIYEFARAGASSTTIGNSGLTEAHLMAIGVMVFGGIVLLVASKRKVVSE